MKRGELLKSKALKKGFSVFIITVSFICIILYLYIFYRNKMKNNNLLNKVNSIVNQNIVYSNNQDVVKNSEQEIFSVEKLYEDNNLIGKIMIPKINIEAPIKEGTSQEILKEAVGHFSSTNYWNGNVCLASHNRGSYAHYFSKLNRLKNGDEIIYQTKLGTRIYKVSQIKEISEQDVSVLNETSENTITLITCITNKQNKRLCVKAIEKSF